MSTTKVTDSLRNVTAVDAAKITTGTIPEARITSLDSTKLTGTVDIARLPSTAVNSNVDLTTLSASNLTSGTVATARLGSGTASSSTFLRGDSTYAEAGGGGGAWNFIRSQTASSSTTMEFTTDIDSTYDVYKIIYSDLEFSADVEFKFRIGASGYDSGSADYTFAFTGSIGGGTSDYNSNSANGIILTGGAWQDGSSIGSAHMEVTLYTPSETTHNKTIGVQYVGQSSNGKAHHLVGAGVRFATAAYTRIQLSLQTGTIVSGTARLYGISNS